MNENEQNINPNLDFTNGVKVPDSDRKSFPFRPAVKEPRIYIEKEVYEEMQNHAMESTTVELCGVLVGKMYADESGNFLHIVGSIRGEYARNQGTNVSFTPETWDYINEQRETKYPDYKVIGWYHTHPGFGVFFSGMDKFIQDYFFNEPYYIAVVIDPKADNTGCFAWINGKLKGLSKWWVGNEEVELTVGPVGNELQESDFLKEEDDDDREQISEDFIAYYEEFKKSGKEGLSNVWDILRANGGAPMLIAFVMFIFGFLVSSYLNSQKLVNAYSRVSRVENREAVTNIIDEIRTSENFEKIVEVVHKFQKDILVELYFNALPKEVKQQKLDMKYQPTDADLASIPKEAFAGASIEIMECLNRLGTIAEYSYQFAEEAKTRKDKISEFLERHQTYPSRISQNDEDIRYMREIISENLKQEVTRYVGMMKAAKVADVEKYQHLAECVNYIEAVSPNINQDIKFKKLANEILATYNDLKEAEQNLGEAGNSEVGLFGKGEEKANEQPKSVEQPVAVSEQPKSAEQPVVVPEQSNIQANDGASVADNQQPKSDENKPEANQAQ